MAASQVELAVSNMDLYPIDLPGRASWGSHVEQLNQYLDDTGFSSFEIHPTTATYLDMVGAQEDSGKKDAVSAVVGSMHQTFNEGKGLVGAMGAVAGLLRSEASYRDMVTMQHDFDPMPLVVYPSAALERYTEIRLPRSPLVMQPAPEIYRDYEITTGKGSNEKLLERMGAMSIRGLCPDTVHARRTAEDGFKGPDIADVWADQFASGKVYQMHVAADRVDMAGRDQKTAEKSHQEFVAFTQSWRKALKTEMGDMLVDAIQNWKAPVDLGARALRMVVEVPPLPREFRRRKAQHSAFLDSLAQLAEHAGAEPIMRRKA